MTTVPSEQPSWRKSTHSDHDTCVEVRNDLYAVGDTKTPDGPKLTGDVRSLVAAIKAGEIG